MLKLDVRLSLRFRRKRSLCYAKNFSGLKLLEIWRSEKMCGCRFAFAANARFATQKISPG
ncbi:hypothetical protein NSQ62_18955 [Solibacillus sp. FSL H8-0523]|uniref:hypothetical protein n=1 Tax=Solibacillus sp. FSL H8-0523 TaxID=2954511 RepID=UPI0031017771